MTDKNCVTYEDFGAVGDGVTNDFAALYAAHAYANEHGLPVRANDEAHYYIGEPIVDGEIREIEVRTDVSWGKARFTIDDREISLLPTTGVTPWYSKNIFRILPDTPEEKITDEAVLRAMEASGLGPGSVKVPLALGYPAMIIPYNLEAKVFRRRGYGAWKGSEAHEIIVIDAEGNISGETPLFFSYPHIDYITVIRLDVRPITVEGGIFTTRACGCNLLYTDENGEQKRAGGYIGRGLSIRRSYTTVRNIQHYITDEVPMKSQVNENGEIVWIAPCYSAFFSAAFSDHVTFEDCIMTGRRCYRRPTGGTGGTYDLGGNAVNKIVFKNCRQSNFWVTVDEDGVIHPAKEGDPGALTSMSSYTVNGVPLMMHWGIGGTNFCKNMEYIGCTLSRFDAHQGLYNGKIVDSTVNALSLIGAGTLIFENSRWFTRGLGKTATSANALFYLRNDYASTWEGTLITRNSEIHTVLNGERNVFLCCHTYTNWDFGYQAHFPSIVIENLRCFDYETHEALPAGTRLYLTGTSVDREPDMHRATTLQSDAIFPDVDEDGDGLVDGTQLPCTGVPNPKGVAEPGNRRNLNPIIPPRFMEIRGESECEIIVQDTSAYEDGGFFGKTEFITDKESCTGTAQKACGAFRFEKVEHTV